MLKTLYFADHTSTSAGFIKNNWYKKTLHNTCSILPINVKKYSHTKQYRNTTLQNNEIN